MLNRRLIRNLKDAGLDALQLSVDRMTPTASTRKSLQSVIPKLELLKKLNLRFHISGVLYRDTLKEAKQVLAYGLSHGIPTHARLIHANPDGEYGVDTGTKEELDAFIDYQIKEKKKGRKIHTLGPILDFQKSLLKGESLNWTCVAGYKFIFVSAKGKFWLCSTKREPNVDIMKVTPELLKSYHYKKECQKDCGVYCFVADSMAFNHPLRFGIRLAMDRLIEKTAQLMQIDATRL
jgi:MoaA/NifB/PqqE/SkfB family radical SAM enzyme